VGKEHWLSAGNTPQPLRCIPLMPTMILDMIEPSFVFYAIDRPDGFFSESRLPELYKL
jgi:hypothetical protein